MKAAAAPLLPGLDLAPVRVVKARRRVVSPATAAGRVRKGRRVELGIVAAHEEIGVAACSVRRSGAMASRLGESFAGDVKIWARGARQRPFVGEVKSRAGGGGFVQLEKWLGRHDVLFLKRNGLPPLVVLHWETWASLLGGGGE